MIVEAAETVRVARQAMRDAHQALKDAEINLHNMRRAYDRAQSAHERARLALLECAGEPSPDEDDDRWMFSNSFLDVPRDKRRWSGTNLRLRRAWRLFTGAAK
jgi:hypothetical protein